MSIRTTALIAVLAAAAPSAALAQSFAPSVTVGQTVWVTTAQGGEVHGEVDAISGTGIDVSTLAGVKHFSLNDVWMIHKKDSNREGFLIGAGVGAFLGWFESGMIPPGDRPAAVGLTALMYGGLGALFDNMIEGRDMLYHRPEHASGDAVMHIAPIIGLDGPKRVGVGGKITWR